jgi:uncharacterized OsmC-like protein
VTTEGVDTLVVTAGRDIKSVQERTIRALKKSSSLGRGTRVASARIKDGFRCEVEDGKWKLASDLTDSDGGDESAPDPGTLVRAGLAGCLASSFVIFAARMDIELEDIEVTVETDYDVRGRMLADSSLPVGWHAVRYTARIRSSAPVEQLREIFRLVEQYSPIADDLARAIPMTGELIVEN